MPALPAAKLPLAALAVALLAGCSASNGPGGQSASAAGALAYNGASAGTDHAKPFACGATATVDSSSNLGSGQVKITVSDGAGQVVYSKTLSSPGQQTFHDAVHGTAGTWTATGERSAGSAGYGAPASFSGQYAVTVTC